MEGQPAIIDYFCGMKFIDTHAHLYDEAFDGEVDEVLQRSFRAGTAIAILPDIDSISRPAMIRLHTKYPGSCPMMLGLHPTSVKQGYKSELGKLEEAIGNHSFCGIGETGIDLYWDKTFVKEQTDAFAYHVNLAIKHDKPLVIHARRSLNEIFDVLSKNRHSTLRGVFHCFPGNWPEAQRAISLGFHLGIGGVVTYKNSGMAEVVKQAGLKHIVLETDAPYLPPVPYRGKRNEPSLIPTIAAFVAALTGTHTAEVAEITSANAGKLFLKP